MQNVEALFREVQLIADTMAELSVLKLGRDSSRSFRAVQQTLSGLLQ